uniref:Sulfotransferase domain-containing protein n=1 Tax=Parascaris univalens TaxID=6257 RepID=A0A915BZT9_PARUN
MAYEICDSDLKEKYFFRVPYAHYLADYIWPGFMISPQRLMHLKDMHFNEEDVIIASYPKSGTTWVSEVVSAILFNANMEVLSKERLDERVPWLELDMQFVWAKFFFIWKSIFEGTSLRLPKRSPRTFFTHLPIELLPRDVLAGKCKMIYVVRNPKDNAVSYFHFHKMARFLGQQKTTWNDFLSLYMAGQLYCGSWFEHVLGYEELARRINNNVLFVQYEQMINDFDSEIQRISKFLGRRLSENQRKMIGEHCSFKAMKGNHMTNRHGVWLFNQKISEFMRKGEVGDWRNYFSVAQKEAFDELFKRKMAHSNFRFICDRFL